MPMHNNIRAVPDLFSSNPAGARFPNWL